MYGTGLGFDLSTFRMQGSRARGAIHDLRECTPLFFIIVTDLRFIVILQRKIQSYNCYFLNNS
jgi:hypothetical protein